LGGSSIENIGLKFDEAPLIGAFFAQVADMMRNQPG
jgi:hypothetical protein